MKESLEGCFVALTWESSELTASLMRLAYMDVCRKTEEKLQERGSERRHN